jgi:catalase
MKEKQEEKVRVLWKEREKNKTIIVDNYKQINALYSLSKDTSQHNKKINIMSIISIFKVLEEKISNKLNNNFEKLDSNKRIKIISEKYLSYIDSLNI